MATNLAGKVALVTGGSQGIGKAVVEAFLNKGMKVCIADVNVSMGEETLKEFQSKYGEENVMFNKCDVTCEKELEETLLAAKRKFGHLDILVNNAGILNENDWEKTIDINVKSVLRGTTLAFKHLSDREGNPGGTVVNTASLLAMATVPEFPSYCASKFAVGAWTRCYGHEANVKRTHVKVAAVCPDITDTPMIWSFPQAAVDASSGMELLNTLKHKRMSPSDIAKGFVKVLEDGVTGVLLTVRPETGMQYVEDAPFVL